LTAYPKSAILAALYWLGRPLELIAKARRSRVGPFFVHTGIRKLQQIQMN
jgi:hypothetical protein